MSEIYQLPTNFSDYEKSLDNNIARLNALLDQTLFSSKNFYYLNNYNQTVTPYPTKPIELNNELNKQVYTPMSTAFSEKDLKNPGFIMTNSYFVLDKKENNYHLNQMNNQSIISANTYNYEVENATQSYRSSSNQNYNGNNNTVTQNMPINTNTQAMMNQYIFNNSIMNQKEQILQYNSHSVDNPNNQKDIYIHKNDNNNNNILGKCEPNPPSARMHFLKDRKLDIPRINIYKVQQNARLTDPKSADIVHSRNNLLLSDNPLTEKTDNGSYDNFSTDNSNDIDSKRRSEIISPYTRKSSYSARKKSRRKNQVENLVEKNFRKYETSMELMNKYTSPEIIDKLSESTNGNKILRMSIRASSGKLKSRESSPSCQRYSVKSQDKIPKLQEIFDKVITIPKEDAITMNEQSHRKVITIYEYVNENYEDGSRYEGEKFLNKKHGNGTYYYKDGYKYEGSWENDKMSGFGILWFNQDKKWYEGQWEDNNFNGNGILYNDSPNFKPTTFDGTNFLQLADHWLKYQGAFQNGKKNGFGNLFLTNGDIFIGHFVNDTVHGRGSYTKSGLKPIVGLWECNKLSSLFQDVIVLSRRLQTHVNSIL